MTNHIPAEDFAAYVDGMLGPEKKNELENHFSQCPACQDELLEIAEIVRSRNKAPAGGQGKIPAQFLKLALGEKSKTTQSVLHLRRIFEIAAVFVVVVFVGYLYISNNRFWQTPGQKKPSVVSEKNISPADTSFRDPETAPLPVKPLKRTDAKKADNEQTKSEADQRLNDSLAFKKRKSSVGDKGMPVAQDEYLPGGKGENQLQESAAEKLPPAIVQKNLPKKEHGRATAETEAVSDVQIAFAGKDETAVKAVEMKVGGNEQNLERQKEPGAGATQPIAVKEEKSKGEESLLKSTVVVPEKLGAAKPASAGEKQDSALMRKEIADSKILPPVRIEGDAVWSDLRNPELFIAWPWFQKGLALELRIDAAGTVTAVVPLGNFDPLIVKQVTNEARKLLFSVSKKKSRRARLVANEKPPNPR